MPQSLVHAQCIMPVIYCLWNFVEYFGLLLFTHEIEIERIFFKCYAHQMKMIHSTVQNRKLSVQRDENDWWIEPLFRCESRQRQLVWMQAGPTYQTADESLMLCHWWYQNVNNSDGHSSIRDGKMVITQMVCWLCWCKHSHTQSHTESLNYRAHMHRHTHFRLE